jgi:hypothetical protein
MSTALVAGFLGIEAVLGLLFVPIVVRSGHGPLGVRVGASVAVAVGLLIAAGITRRRQRAAIVLGTALQGAVIACGAIAWPMYVLGVIFAALWYAALRLRRQVG